MNFHADGPEALLGRTLGGYRLITVLGQGATGAVFLGKHTSTTYAPDQQYVAIKVLLLPWQLAPEERNVFRERFRREAQVLLGLRHPNILPILAFNEEQGLSYMILPHLSGGTLSELLKAHQAPIPLSVISHDLEKIANALDYAHRRGIIHRDIKPSNILFDEEGAIYLADFSIAAFQQTSQTNMTTMGKILGTPLYIAPELIQEERATLATDIYSLGVVIYEVVTGRPPFHGNAYELFIQHVTELPPSPRLYRDDLPLATERVILQALAKRPTERFASVQSFAHAFSQSIPSGRSSFPQRQQKQFLTTKRLVTVIRLLILGQLTGSLYAIRFQDGHREEGEIRLLHGQIVYARIGSLEGKSVEQKLALWLDCAYLFVETANSGPLYENMFRFMTNGLERDDETTQPS